MDDAEETSHLLRMQMGSMQKKRQKTRKIQNRLGFEKDKQKPGFPSNLVTILVTLIQLKASFHAYFSEKVLPNRQEWQF